MNATFQGQSAEQLTRERKVELIVSNGHGTLLAMGLRPDPGMIRRFLESKDDAGLNEWFNLMMPGGVS